MNVRRRAHPSYGDRRIPAFNLPGYNLFTLAIGAAMHLYSLPPFFTLIAFLSLALITIVR